MPVVSRAQLQRVLLDDYARSLPFNFSWFMTNEVSASLTFTVSPGLTCVSSVEYTLSESSVASNATAYLFTMRDAGVGRGQASDSVAVVAPPTLESSGSVAPALGWMEARSFEIRVDDAPMTTGQVYYAIIRTVNCGAVEGFTTVSVPLLFDDTLPQFAGDPPSAADKAPVTVYTTNRVLFATWPQLVDTQSNVVFATAQFLTDGTPVSEPVDVSQALSVWFNSPVWIPDGTAVTMSLVATNGAAGTAIFSSSAVVDGTPPVCSEVLLLGTWAAAGVVVRDNETDSGGNATITAQVDCEDPHTSVVRVVMSVGYGSTTTHMCICDMWAKVWALGLCVWRGGGGRFISAVYDRLVVVAPVQNCRIW